MNKRENRVINAFVNCVKTGEFSFNYAVTLIEDSTKYGYLSNEAKEVFYAECGEIELVAEDKIAE